MALVVLVFLSILLATFGLVIAMTRPSPQEKIHRAADGIDPPYRRRTRPATPPKVRNCSRRRGQSRFVWLDEILEPYSFAQAIAEAHSPGEQLDHALPL